MDTIIFGRDVDQSGDDPRGDVVASFPGHAGVGPAPHSPRRSRKGSYALKSTMDTAIFGTDMDKSGADPHGKLLDTYPEHAGSLRGEKPPRRSRKGDHGMESTADSTIWGHDIDGSGVDPHAKLVGAYKGHAGMRPEEKQPRCLRQCDLGMKSTLDTVVFGRDLDRSGVDPHGEMLEAYSGYAGVISGGRAARKPKAKAKAAVGFNDQRSDPKDLQAPDSQTFAPPPRGENQRAPSSCCSRDSAKPRWR